MLGVCIVARGVLVSFWGRGGHPPVFMLLVHAG